MTGKREKAVSVLRWAARLWGLLISGLVLLIVVGEGGLRPQVLFGEGILLWLVLPCLGLLMAWRWEAIGGGLTVACMVGFHIRELLLNGKLPSGPFWLAIALAGMLFLVVAFLSKPQKPGENTASERAESEACEES